MYENGSEKVFFIHLTGENEKLAIEEIKSVIQATGEIPKILGTERRLLFIKSKLRTIQRIAKRIVLAHAIYENFLIFNFLDYKEGDLENAIKIALESASIERFFTSCKSFGINKCIKVNGKNLINSEKLKKKVGEVIKRKTKCKVDLEGPEIRIDIFVHDKGIAIGKWITRTARKEVIKSGPAIRPIKHSSTMNPIHARVLVNLSQVRESEILLDPFCGSGGILIEGRGINVNLIGIDINPKMLRGAIKNFHFFNLKNYELIRGNALKLPFRDSFIDAIATDPPYGKAASTHGLNFKVLLSNFLEEAERVLKSGRYIALAMPSKYDIYELIPSNSLKVKILEDIYIHKKLVRKFVAIRKEK
ncbi:MAG: methyltransferase domain-containing protein [Candidatus Asgardarchaeia archaeon]